MPMDCSKKFRESCLRVESMVVRSYMGCDSQYAGGVVSLFSPWPLPSVAMDTTEAYHSMASA